MSEKDLILYMKIKKPKKTYKRKVIFALIRNKNLVYKKTSIIF